MGRAFEYRKDRKMKRWAGMAKAFTRIGREISIAVKEGGPDPNYNARLRLAIQNAKAANMPKANVENAIKNAVSKDAENFEEIVYEGYAPHGIAMVVETATNNPNRTVANVRHIFSKYGGNLSTSGSVDYMFTRKAIFKVPDTGQDLEELEFALIDFGLEELRKEDELVRAYEELDVRAHVAGYLPRMELALAASDACVCRGGAGAAPPSGAAIRGPPSPSGLARAV